MTRKFFFSNGSSCSCTCPFNKYATEGVELGDKGELRGAASTTALRTGATRGARRHCACQLCTSNTTVLSKPSPRTSQTFTVGATTTVFQYF